MDAGTFDSVLNISCFYSRWSAGRHLQLTLPNGNQRFEAISTSNLEMYKFRNLWKERKNVWLLYLFFPETSLNLNLYRNFLKKCLTLLPGGESLPDCFGKEVNWWRVLTQRFWWNGEQRWILGEGWFKILNDGCIEMTAIDKTKIHLTNFNIFVAMISTIWHTITNSVLMNAFAA